MGCRSSTKRVTEFGFFTNTVYNYAAGACIVGQLLVIYLPFLQAIFQTEALTVFDLVFVFVISSSVFWVDEWLKIPSLKPGLLTRKRTYQKLSDV